MSKRLFVYGSLKRGQRHHGELEGASFAGEARTASGYRLVLQGEYPALTRSGAGRVSGELFVVGSTLLERLDSFEGCPSLYQRRCVELEDGSVAFSYLIEPERAARYVPIPSGSWP